MTELTTRIAEATQARQRLLDCLRRFTPAQAAFKPYSSVWSIAENVEHLVLAEQGSVNRVWSAAESLHAGKPYGQATRFTAGGRSRRSLTRPGSPDRKHPIWRAHAAEDR